MKKVIIEEPSNIHIRNINSSFYIGVKSHEGYKMQLLDVKDKRKMFVLIRNGECSSIEGISLRHVITNLIEEGLENFKGYKNPCEVYCFETEHELKEWLYE